MTKKIQHCCHTCQKSFSDSNELRSHVQYFQCEMQKLLARLIEVQAHLPPSDPENSTSDDSEDEDEVDDRNAVDDVHGCPDPKCVRREGFRGMQQLEIHYQKHVRCLDICTCGALFTNVRASIRHKCKSQTGNARGNKNRQWRRMAKQELAVILEKQQSPARRRVSTRKRVLGKNEPLPNPPPPKRPRTLESHTLDQASGVYEALHDYDPPIHPSSLPDRIDGAVATPDALAMPQASVSFPDAVELAAPNFVPESMTAPILWDYTIPPFPMMQPPDASCFPSNTTFSGGTDTSCHFSLPG